MIHSNRGATYADRKLPSIRRDQITADGTAAFNPNITGFIKAGGKLIHYHGGSDGNIP
jgi:hypothetical protein